MARSLLRGARRNWRVAGVARGIITDNGNAILDVHDLTIDDPARLESRSMIGQELSLAACLPCAAPMR